MRLWNLELMLELVKILGACLLALQGGNGGVLGFWVFVFCFFLSTHRVWVSGWESGFWKSTWKINGICGICLQ